MCLEKRLKHAVHETDVTNRSPTVGLPLSQREAFHQ